MADEPGLFVVCNNCSSEVSPYVTECPYCGQRLRKRAPDLKKMKKQEERAEKKRAARAARTAPRPDRWSEVNPGAWMDAPADRPVVTGVLVFVAVVVSVLQLSGMLGLTVWDHLIAVDDVAAEPWTLLTAPFFQGSFGSGFVCLVAFALFGAGLERRVGWWAPLLVWILCGALGIAVAEVASIASGYGAYAIAVGAVLSWTLLVSRSEDLSDYDTLGLAAVALVLCALPIVTKDVRLAQLVGGVIGGLLSGLIFSARRT
jgi:membrane associated rhomboid family serine protease